LRTLDDAPITGRFVRELLRLTAGKRVASLEQISTYSSCSIELARRLATELGIQVLDGTVQLSRELRLDIAMSEANRGFLHDPSRFLEWRDFERFAERCLIYSGFETKRDVRIKGDGRNWQMDVIGIRDQLLLCLDCKHWAPPMSPSRFKDPENHQSAATRLYARKLAKERNLDITSLPVILTLFEPHHNISERAVIVEIQRLPSLLRDLTPYTPDLPFIAVDAESGEKPISNITTSVASL
jgi:hypothetical protein